MAEFDPLDDYEDHGGLDPNPTQEAAEPRKLYGTSTPMPNFAGMLPNAGDPMFVTDGQNNDEFYVYDSDVPREVEDTSQPSYTGGPFDSGIDEEDGAG